MARRVKTPTNSAVARGIGTSVPKARSWKAFDALPPLLRRLMWEAPVPINPLSVTTLLDAGGEDYALNALCQAIRGELSAFDAQHQKVYGCALPHMAADATLQSYGA